MSLLQPDIEKYKSIQKLIQVSPNGNSKQTNSIFLLSKCFYSDPSRQHLVLNNESLQICSQVLNNLSHLFYTFSRIANTCLIDDNNQQQNHFQTRLTLVHQ